MAFRLLILHAMEKTMDFSEIRLFLFDMDGTLYLGDALFPFTKPLLDTIRAQGKTYLFMTNNSSKSVNDYVKKLERLGIPASYEDFITSSQATADYLMQNHPGLTFYVCGTESFKRELAAAGVKVSDAYSDAIEGVVMGYDTELTYQKLDDVSRLLTLHDLPYIAANPDFVCPTEYGYVPDCGSVCGMIYNATGKNPHYIGKPRPEMPLSAMARIAKRDPAVNAGTTLVIGDRLYTDIACGVAAGIHSLLVLSGESTMADVEKSDVKPEFIMRDCAELLEKIK